MSPVRLPGLRLTGRLAELAGTVAIVIVWVAFFRPLMFGGPAEYVVVAGHSMEPTFYTGDLAITQRQPAYEVGDIVAYKTGGGVVIHRIIGGDAVSGYLVQGDNRTAPDVWRPQPDAILGKVWIGIPKVGTMLALVRKPAILAAVVAALAFLLVFNSGPIRLPGRRRPMAADTGSSATRTGP